MRVLLPPSETKRSGGSTHFDPSSLAHSLELREARDLVRAALEALCSEYPVAAARALKLGTKNAHELERNLHLATSGAMPAAERYTGVLYDALDVSSLDESARAWVRDHVYVQSALFGLVSASDEIPAYRLSASSRLPALHAPLKRVWLKAHAGLDLAGEGLVLDLRSKDYAALAPSPGAVVLNIAQRGPDGAVRALNHFNKSAKGDLVRRLAASGAEIDSSGAFVEWARDQGLDLIEDEQLTLVTELGAPR